MRQTGFTHESTSLAVPIEWYTPPRIFEALNIAFDMDVASPGREFVPWIPARIHLTVKENGLITPWRGSVWCNPPYGARTPAWVQKFCEHRNGILLVFSRTDTAWFHTLTKAEPTLLFVKGRIAFVKGGGPVRETMGAACGSMLAAFGEPCRQALFGSRLGPVFERASESRRQAGRVFGGHRICACTRRTSSVE